MWPMLALTAGTTLAGAAMGKQRAQREREIEDADRKLAAETQRYSWITGNNAQPIRSARSEVDQIGQGALSGMMQGASLGSQFGGFGNGGAADPKPGLADGKDNFWMQMKNQKKDPMDDSWMTALA